MVAHIMFSWVSDKKSNLKNLSTYNFTLIRNKFESCNFNLLPVIEEEERYLSEEESELTPKLSKRNIINNNYNNKKANRKNDSKKTSKSSEKLKVANTFIKLPSLVNINCLMNTDIKQTKDIWNTNFGKRLINGKKPNESKGLTEVNFVKYDFARKSRKKARFCQKPKRFSKKEFIQKQNSKTGEVNQIKKSEPNSGDETIAKEIAIGESDVLKSTSEIHTCGSFSEISLKEVKEISSGASSLSKNQRILTECVKNILDKRSAEFCCEHCSQSFYNVKELSNHKRQHEIKRETCIICEKVFFNQNEFIQHLLTHESVDHFSCKKCKKYFPNLKKYKKHCQDFHLTPPGTVIYGTRSDVINTKKLL